jgi:hypothetical protein
MNSPPLAVGTLLAIAAAKLAIHLPALTRYGWFRDELYYVASTDHLGWGFVDHPPLSIAVLALVRAVFGDSLAAIRMVPVLAGVATVFVAGGIARQLGGGRFAQGLAALTTLMAPVLLGQSRCYSMNALDVLVWALATSLLLRALDGGVRHWAALGVALGLGLLNKVSVLWLGGGIAAGLLLTPYRRTLRTPGPWLAAAIAGVTFAPHLLWQARHDWPTLEFMRNAAGLKMAALDPTRFAIDQILNLNVGSAPVWVAGLVFGLFGREGARGRVLALIWLATLAILLTSGSARASYLAPAYAGLIALGAVQIERFTDATPREWLRLVGVAAVVLPGLAAVPLALPVLPVETFVRYQAALGFAPRTEERVEVGPLPQYYADMFGWDQMVMLVSKAYLRLTPEERERCRVFGQNYGEAGAVDVLGRRLGLPRAIGGHNSYWMWGPGDGPLDVIIAIGGDREDNAEFFEDIAIVGRTDSRWSMPYERGLDVWIGRKPRLGLREAWPRLKRYL